MPCDAATDGVAQDDDDNEGSEAAGDDERYEIGILLTWRRLACTSRLTVFCLWKKGVICLLINTLGGLKPV